MTDVEQKIIESSAIIEGDHRYILRRSWSADDITVLWIMLNPSTADAFTDDPTIRRCISFSKNWGAGSLAVVNLYALRATDSGELTRHPAPIGRKNDTWLASALRTHRRHVIVAAWGASKHASSERIDRVARLAEQFRAPLQCLGLTKAGHPKHPLYLKSDTPLIPFPTCQDSAK
jgi:hypothetical protein